MLEVKNIVTETKNAFDGPTKNWAQLRKESVSLRIYKQKLLKLKNK